MTTATVVLIGLAAGTYALKAAAPLLLGDHTLPQWVGRISELLPAAVLASLVGVSALTQNTAYTIDARLVGLAAAAVSLYLRAPFVVVVVVAAAATALTRLA